MTRSEQKRLVIEAIGVLLGVVPGVKIPWETIAFDLQRLPLATLRAFHYRIDRQISHSYDEGVKASL